MNFSGARCDFAMIGSLPPPREFRACPTHKDFVEFGISDFNHLSQRQDREESIRRYEAHHTSLPLIYGISVKRWSQENPQHSQLRHLSSDSKTNYQTNPEMSSKKPTQRSAIADVVAREYTIHMHKRVCRLDYPSRIIESQQKRRERRRKESRGDDSGFRV